jgi:hypothetical protein
MAVASFSGAAVASVAIWGNRSPVGAAVGASPPAAPTAAFCSSK